MKELQKVIEDIANHPDVVKTKINDAMSNLTLIMGDHGLPKRREKCELIQKHLVNYDKNIEYEHDNLVEREYHYHVFNFKNGWQIRMNIEFATTCGESSYSVYIIIKNGDTELKFWSETEQYPFDKTMEKVDKKHRNRNALQTTSTDGYEELRPVIEIFINFLMINLFHSYFR